VARALGASYGRTSSENFTQDKGIIVVESTRMLELEMAPHAGFDTESIKEKARKDLLHLLEGVSKADPPAYQLVKEHS